MKRWKNIKVPEDVKKAVVRIAEEKDLRQYEVIKQVVELEDRLRLARRRLEEVPQGVEVQSLAWHLTKVIYGLGRVVEAVVEGRDYETRLAKTVESIRQLKERFGVDTWDLEGVLKQYVSYKTNEDLQLTLQVAAQAVREAILKAHELIKMAGGS